MITEATYVSYLVNGKEVKTLAEAKATGDDYKVKYRASKWEPLTEKELNRREKFVLDHYVPVR